MSGLIQPLCCGATWHTMWY